MNQTCYRGPPWEEHRVKNEGVGMRDKECQALESDWQKEEKHLLSGLSLGHRLKTKTHT